MIPDWIALLGILLLFIGLILPVYSGSAFNLTKNNKKRLTELKSKKNLTHEENNELAYLQQNKSTIEISILLFIAGALVLSTCFVINH